MCKKCKDWTLHNRAFTQPHDLTCKVCDTVFTEIPIVEIPMEKVKEQRERHKEMNLNHARGFMTGMYFGASLVPGMMDLFSSGERDVIITESDAGQNAIDERKRIARAKKAEEERIIQEDQSRERVKYYGLGRNDICLCGSGKKYKKCCLNRILSFN